MGKIELDGVNFEFRTSYFYQLRFMAKHPCMVPVSICIWNPKWYSGISYRALVPKSYDAESDCESCVKIHGDDPMYDGGLKCGYLEQYRKQLGRFNVKRTLEDVAKVVAANVDINAISEVRNGQKWITVVFVGYEVPAKRCSERFALAAWINESMGQNGDIPFCVELKYPLQ